MEGDNFCIKFEDIFNFEYCEKNYDKFNKINGILNERESNINKYEIEETLEIIEYGKI